MHTFCRYCLASCGVEVTVEAGRVVKISADKENPHSRADFCAKDRTAGHLVDHRRRITRPLRRVGDAYIEATWDEAIADIAARMSAIIEAGTGPRCSCGSRMWTSCWSAPIPLSAPGIGWSRCRAAARQRPGAKIVVVFDPIRTETAEKVIFDDSLEHRADCTDLALGVSELRRPL